jgi:hypothetical protein
MDLTLYIAGENIPLSTDTVLGVLHENPYLKEDWENETASYPLRLPTSPPLLNAIDHTNRLDTGGSDSIGATWWMGGFPHLYGQLKTLDRGRASAEQIEANFVSEDFGVIEAAKAVKIRTLLDVIDVEMDIADWQCQLELVLPNTTGTLRIVINGVNIELPTYAGDVSYRVMEFYQIAIPRALPDVYVRYDLTTLYLYSKTLPMDVMDSGTIPNPMFGWTVTTRKTYENTGEKSWKDFVANAVLNSTKFAFPLMINQKPYAEKTPINFQGVINNINQNVNTNVIEAPFNEPFVGTEARFDFTYSPCVFLGYVLSKIVQKLDLTELASDFSHFEELKKIVIESNYCVDYVVKYKIIQSDDSPIKYLNSFLRKIDLNKCVPDFTIYDFLDKICKVFGLQIIIKDNVLHLNLKKTKIDGQIIGITNTYVDGSMRRDFKEKKGVKLLVTKDTEDLATQSEDRFFGTGGHKVILPFDAPKSSYDTSFGYVPFIQKKMNSLFSEQNNNNNAFRLLMYRGLTTYNIIHRYPYATRTAFDPDNITPLGSLSLELDTPEGLYTRCHENVIELTTDGYELQCLVVMYPHDLRKITDNWEEAIVYLNLPEGSVKACIKSVEFRCNVRDLELTKMILTVFP